MHTPATAPVSRPMKSWVSPGVTYAMSMGCSSLTVVGLGELLIAVAENVGTTSTGLAYAFLGRAIAQFVVVVSAPTIYRHFEGNLVMAAALAVLVFQWLVLPHITALTLLYAWFGITGMCASTLDIGAQINVKRVYADKAGPWLMATTAVFATAGFLAPLISYIGKGSIAKTTAVFSAYNLLCFLLVASNAHMQCHLNRSNEQLRVRPLHEFQEFLDNPGKGNTLSRMESGESGSTSSGGVDPPLSESPLEKQKLGGGITHEAHSGGGGAHGPINLETSCTPSKIMVKIDTIIPGDAVVPVGGAPFTEEESLPGPGCFKVRPTLTPG
ncbi:unnamed protein product [Discosporangium mesarthrocarpum]